jgi:hypothetical protein
VFGREGGGKGGGGTKKGRPYDERPGRGRQAWTEERERLGGGREGRWGEGGRAWRAMRRGGKARPRESSALRRARPVLAIGSSSASGRVQSTCHIVVDLSL